MSKLENVIPLDGYSCAGFSCIPRLKEPGTRSNYKTFFIKIVIHYSQRCFVYLVKNARVP